MAIVTIEETNLTNIAGAIREKNGTQTTYKPSEMAAAIQAISAGSGNGFNTNDYDVTIINGERYTSSGGNYYQWTTWKNYISSVDDIEMLVAFPNQANAYIYIKGFLSPIDANTLPAIKCNYSSSRWTITNSPDSAINMVFSDKGVLYYSGGSITTPSQYNSFYLVTKKGVV